MKEENRTTPLLVKLENGKNVWRRNVEINETQEWVFGGERENEKV